MKRTKNTRKRAYPKTRYLFTNQLVNLSIQRRNDSGFFVIAFARIKAYGLPTDAEHEGMNATIYANIVLPNRCKRIAIADAQC